MTRPGLLLVGHGSRDERGAREFLALVDLVRARAPAIAVEAGFLELAQPTALEAAARLVARGVRDVVVLPVMLLAAGHTKLDVAAVVDEARARHAGTRFRYGRDLGLHPVVLGLLAERLEEAVATAHRRSTTVLLVGRGSSDPDANADVFKVARLLHEGGGYQAVETCFVGITWPRVPEGLERCRKLGAQRVVVLPYFLFTGVLERRIHEQCAAFARANPELHVRVARSLGPDPRVAALLLERYREALAGEVHMNCDLCVHRRAVSWGTMPSRRPLGGAHVHVAP